MHLFTNTNEHIDECRVATQTRLVHFVNQFFATQGKQSTLCNGNLRVVCLTIFLTKHIFALLQFGILVHSSRRHSFTHVSHKGLHECRRLSVIKTEIVRRGLEPFKVLFQD